MRAIAACGLFVAMLCTGARAQPYPVEAAGRWYLFDEAGERVAAGERIVAYGREGLPPLYMVYRRFETDWTIEKDRSSGTLYSSEGKALLGGINLSLWIHPPFSGTRVEILRVYDTVTEQEWLLNYDGESVTALHLPGGMEADIGAYDDRAAVLRVDGEYDDLLVYDRLRDRILRFPLHEALGDDTEVHDAYLGGGIVFHDGYLVDMDGNAIAEERFLGATRVSPDLLAVYAQDGSRGLLRNDGTRIPDSGGAVPTADGLTLESIGGRTCLYVDGRRALAETFDSIDLAEEGLIATTRQGTLAFYARDMQRVPLQALAYRRLDHGYLLVQDADRVWIVDAAGREVALPSGLPDARCVVRSTGNAGDFVVRLDGKEGIARGSNMQVAARWYAIEPTEAGKRAIVWTLRGERYVAGVVDVETGERVADARYDGVDPVGKGAYRLQLGEDVWLAVAGRMVPLTGEEAGGTVSESD